MKKNFYHGFVEIQQPKIYRYKHHLLIVVHIEVSDVKMAAKNVQFFRYA